MLASHPEPARHGESASWRSSMVSAPKGSCRETSASIAIRERLVYNRHKLYSLIFFKNWNDTEILKLVQDD